jgi:hypothetical protein
VATAISEAFSYGNAPFEESMAGRHMNSPIIGAVDW